MCIYTTIFYINVPKKAISPSQDSGDINFENKV